MSEFSMLYENYENSVHRLAIIDENEVVTQGWLKVIIRKVGGGFY